MDKHGKVTGQIKADNMSIEVNLSFISFEDGGCRIVYCPALDLSGYGHDEEEAQRSFETSIEEFFRYTLNKKTFAKVLTDLGWTLKPKARRQRITPPSMDFLLSNNSSFREIFNNHAFSKFDRQISMPAYA